MAGNNDDVVVRMRLIDDMTARLRRIDAESKAVTADLRKMADPQHARNVNLFGGAIDSLHTRLGALDGRLSRISGMLTGALATGLRSLTFGLAAATAGVTIFGLTAVNQFQRAHATFNVLTGSVASGNRLFGQLQQFNYRSPFQLPDITSSAQTLLGFGFNAQSVLPIEKRLADVASVQQDPSGALARMALAVGQIRQTGVVRAQDLNQLVQAGLPAYAVAGQAAGGGNVRAMLRSHQQISSQAFLAQLIAPGGPLEKYSGAARAQVQTVSGQWSNFVDKTRVELSKAFGPLGEELVHTMPALTKAVGAFVDGIAPELSKVLLDLLHGAQQVMPLVQPIISGLFEGIHAFLTGMQPALVQLAPVAPQIGKALADLLTAFAQPPFVQAVVDLVGLLPTMIEDLTHLVPILGVFVGLLDRALQLGPVHGLVAGILITLLGYRLLSGVAKAVLEFAGSIGVLRAELAAGGYVGGGGVMLPGGRGRRGGGPRGSRGAAGLGMLGALFGIGTGVSMFVQGTHEGGATGAFDLIGGGALAGASAGSRFGPFGALAGGLLGAAAGGGTDFGRWWAGGSKDKLTFKPELGVSPFSTAVFKGANPDTWLADHPGWAQRHPETAQFFTMHPGAITIVRPTDPAEVRRELEAYFSEKKARGASGTN